jgi:hypothetical protein
MTQKSKCLSRNRELLATDYRTRRTDEFLQMLGFARAEPRNDGDNTLVPEACFVVPPRSGARPTEVVVFAFVRLLGRQCSMFQFEGFRDAGAVSRIGAGAIGDMTLLDL